jgi:hypothetical protein
MSWQHTIILAAISVLMAALITAGIALVMDGIF